MLSTEAGATIGELMAATGSNSAGADEFWPLQYELRQR
jgi:hypothetical protein